MDLINNIHNQLIFVTLAIGLIVTVRAIYAYYSQIKTTLYDLVLCNSFTLTVTTQALLILSILLFSSFNYEESLRAIEDGALTLFALISTLIGRLIAKKASDHSVRFRFKSVFFGLATGLLLYATLITSTLAN